MTTKTNYSPTFPMFPGAATAVTPSDTDKLAYPSVIYVGGSGDVKVTTAQDPTPVIFVGVPAGFVIPVQVIQVWDADTDATDLVAIY